jgi:hypothetical protein
VQLSRIRVEQRFGMNALAHGTSVGRSTPIARCGAAAARS